MTRKSVDSYEQALEVLFRRINYERVHGDRYSERDFKLDRMRQLLSLLGNPQIGVPTVHIAGTKGKGSTAVLVAEILRAAGYRVGLFTSPHIDAFEERMQVNRLPPTQREMVELVNAILPPLEEMDRSPGDVAPTYFELATALAWLHFRRQQADFVVLETGLGGRLDATNVCVPDVTVITNISRDHMHLLGGTLKQIAAEKAGIIKPKIPCISGATAPEAHAVIERVCRQQQSPLYCFERDIQVRSDVSSISDSGVPADRSIDVATPFRAHQKLPITLAGDHQSVNAALAVAVADTLTQSGRNVSAAAINKGLSGVKWPLRMEVVKRQPTVIVDAAHNWASMAALLDALDAGFASEQKTLIFATTQDKDVQGMLRLAAPRFNTLIFTQYLNNPRALPIDELLRRWQSISLAPAHTANDPASAWGLAAHLSGPRDLVCATGSFFIAAEMREVILDRRPEAAVDFGASSPLQSPQV